MEQRKYFFFDIDGTLIPGAGNSVVPENTRRAIEQLKQRGHFCAIATGRARCMALSQCLAMGFDSLVSDGGNGVMIEGRQEPVIPLDREECLSLIRECEKRQIPWGYSGEDVPQRMTFYPAFAAATDDHYQKAQLLPKIPPEEIPQFIKVYVVCTKEQQPTLEAFTQLSWARYMPGFAFVEPMDKGAGIRRVMQHFGASDADVVVFGDGTNDLSMFRPEWTCIAMGNAVPELKAKASHITRNTEDDGIGAALRHFGWI